MWQKDLNLMPQALNKPFVVILHVREVEKDGGMWLQYLCLDITVCEIILKKLLLTKELPWWAASTVQRSKLKINAFLEKRLSNNEEKNNYLCLFFYWHMRESSEDDFHTQLHSPFEIWSSMGRLWLNDFLNVLQGLPPRIEQGSERSNASHSNHHKRLSNTDTSTEGTIWEVKPTYTVFTTTDIHATTWNQSTWICPPTWFCFNQSMNTLN